MKFDFILWIIVAFHVFLSPFTKVEESFNIQAIHDILNYGYDVMKFDHLDFPGVVPRTFIGSIIISICSYPFIYLSNILMMKGKLIMLYVARIILGTISTWSLIFLKDSAASFLYRENNEKGKIFSNLYPIFVAATFHLPFYMSRPLPNTFALIGTSIAFGLWMKGKPLPCLYIIACITVIFRCDMAILLIAVTFVMLIVAREIPFWVSLWSGVGVSISALVLTVLIDSPFWKPENTVQQGQVHIPVISELAHRLGASQVVDYIYSRFVWPEGVVLFFNTVENKSHEWGVMPYHWYFTNALLKSFHLLLPFIGIGMISFTKPFQFKWKLVKIISPCFAFVCLYSLLPHKELRFIMPVMPVLFVSLVAGVVECIPSAYCSTANSKNKAGVMDVLRVLILLLIFALTCASTCIFTVSSMYNYPGGYAAVRLLEKVSEGVVRGRDGSRTIKVHVDVATCMTGFSRFLQEDSISGHKLMFSKQEDYIQFNEFDVLLSANKWQGLDDTSTKVVCNEACQSRIVDEIYGFERVKVASVAEIKAAVRCVLKEGFKRSCFSSTKSNSAIVPLVHIWEMNLLSIELTPKIYLIFFKS